MLQYWNIATKTLKDKILASKELLNLEIYHLSKRPSCLIFLAQSLLSFRPFGSFLKINKMRRRKENKQTDSIWQKVKMYKLLWRMRWGRKNLSLHPKIMISPKESIYQQNLQAHIHLFLEELINEEFADMSNYTQYTQ